MPPPSQHGDELLHPADGLVDGFSGLFGVLEVAVREEGAVAIVVEGGEGILTVAAREQEEALLRAAAQLLDIERVARLHEHQASDFIEEKEEQYDSPIAQGGTNVSGGQKQRLSIARAIAGKPEIYIFDDSFSALDYKTDAALRKALKEETADATTIIVAQRISTILHAEQIIVLDEGRIAGIGTHKELLKSCEVYHQIAASQLSKEELDNE